jgi:hypothetical protein
MSQVRFFILAWLLFAAVLGGKTWSPPGGLGHALEVKQAIAGALHAPRTEKVERKRSLRHQPPRHTPLPSTVRS